MSDDSEVQFNTVVASGTDEDRGDRLSNLNPGAMGGQAIPDDGRDKDRCELDEQGRGDFDDHNDGAGAARDVSNQKRQSRRRTREGVDGRDGFTFGQRYRGGSLPRRGQGVRYGGNYCHEESDSDVDVSDGDAYREPNGSANPRVNGRHSVFNHGSPSRVPLPSLKPEKYNGQEDWEQYFSHFNNCAELGRWSEYEKLLVLSSCLTGIARTFYIALQEQERSTYRGLVRRLEERFGSTRQQTRYLTRFETRKRQQDETVAMFGIDLRLISQRAYPAIGASGQESIALNQFYKSLSPEMKCRCIDKECRNISEAIEVVERYESIMDGCDKKRSNATLRMVGVKGQDTTKKLLEDIQKIMKRLDVMETNINNKGAMSGRYTGCYGCGSMEHMVRSCPKARPGNRYSGNSKPRA